MEDRSQARGNVLLEGSRSILQYAILLRPVLQSQAVLSRPLHAGHFPSVPCLRRWPTGSLPHRWESAGHLGAGGAQRDLQWPHVALWFRRLGALPDTQLRRPGTLAGQGPPSTELPLEKDSTRASRRVVEDALPRPVPLEPLSPPSSIRAAARRPRSAAPGS